MHEMDKLLDLQLENGLLWWRQVIKTPEGRAALEEHVRKERERMGFIPLEEQATYDLKSLNLAEGLLDGSYK